MNIMSEIRKAESKGNWARKKAAMTGLFRDVRDLDWAEKTIREIGWDTFNLLYVQPEFERLRDKMRKYTEYVIVKDADGNCSLKKVRKDGVEDE